MAAPFAFSFSGDDIMSDEPNKAQDNKPTDEAASGSASAFPVQGKPLLPPVHHDVAEMLARLPSKIAYSLLSVELDGGDVIHLPRRELWDVRVQLMAEDDAADLGADSEVEPGLGKHDVKSGIYEGGFKSWESSVDLVKVLAAQHASSADIFTESPRVIELGCGTALPSLALFTWTVAARSAARHQAMVSFVLADYNPSVLYLVTLPNLLLAWALQQREALTTCQEALSVDGELEITAELCGAFQTFLHSAKVSLSFVSGGWSPAFVNLLYERVLSADRLSGRRTCVIGSETIYSPFALQSFTDTLLHIFQKEQEGGAVMAIVAAKRLYFGVGGSLDDFVAKMRTLGWAVDVLREETEGVRRGVVRCLPP